MSLKEITIILPPLIEEPLVAYISEVLKINQFSIESSSSKEIALKIYTTKRDEPFIKEKVSTFLKELPQWGLTVDFFSIQSRDLEEEDWLHSWQKFFTPIQLNKIRIRPPWEEKKEGFIDLIIHPKMGFGTGQHPTTYLCLKHFEEEKEQYKNIADMGAGSGILGATALLLGAKKVDFFEKDPPALESCHETLALNFLQKKGKIYEMDLLREFEQFALNKKYDFAFINIIAEVIVELLDLPSVQKITTLYLTGIIEEKKHMVLEKIQEIGFQILKEESLENWIFYKITKKTI